MKRENIQAKLEMMTGRWWFFLFFVLMQFVIPPYASKGFDWSEIGSITGEVLSNAMIYGYPMTYPIFKIIPIFLVLSIASLANRVNRFFSFYVGINYILFAFLQSIAVTQKYGLSIITLNLFLFIIVATFWFWEAIVQRNDLTPQKQPRWKYWVIPVAILAFFCIHVVFQALWQYRISFQSIY